MSDVRVLKPEEIYLSQRAQSSQRRIRWVKVSGLRPEKIYLSQSAQRTQRKQSGSASRKKIKIMHRAETPRRRENQNQDLVALSCEKPLQGPLGFNPA